MKTLTGVIALVLALLFAASNGVVAAEQKSPPTGVEKKQPASGEKRVKLDRFQPLGKVTQVNEKAKTFTVMAKGKAVTFNAAKLKVLPKVGEIIDITYTETPGGPMEATTINRVGPPPRPIDPKGLPVPPPPRPFDPKGLEGR
jgi:hypothetical protein